MEKGLTDDNSTEETQVNTLTWSRLISAAMLLGCVYMHSNGYPLALPMLTLGVIVLGFSSFLEQFKIARDSFSIAMSINMGYKHIIHAVQMINPYTGGMSLLLVAHGIVSYYLYIHGVTLGAIIAILPSITIFVVFSRLGRFITDESVKELAKQQLKSFDEEQQKLEIFQEELNKVMPQIEHAANERIEEIFGKPQQEETTDESRELDDPDH